MTQKEPCSCSSSPKLIFPCSGAADTGEISDRAGRKLSKEGAGKMLCIVGISGNVSGIVASTRAAAKILVIDGCPLDCGRKTFEASGFKDFAHLRVTDLGFEKGNSPATPERIDAICHKAETLLSC